MTTNLKAKLLEIFFKVDSFCKELSTMDVQSTKINGSKNHRNRKGKLEQREIITILIFYQLKNSNMQILD
jgi:hypothetical protein